MIKNKGCFALFFLLGGLTLLVLTGCSHTPTPLPTPTVPGAFEIDPLLYEYYHDLGGQKLFGPPISPLITRSDMFCQYTANALLCQNPLQTGHNRYFLWPIGSERLQPQMEADSQPPDTYEIFPDFLPLYQSMGSVAVLGMPLSNPVYNHEAQRIEQIFERVGFYQRFTDPPGSAHLLPYGKYDCGEACSAYRTDLQFGGITPYASSQIGSPFSIALQQAGGEAVFGRPLTEPYQAPNGDLEQVYEGIVIFSSPDSPTQSHLRPIPRLLNMHALPPAPHDPGKGNVVFFETGDGLGYHVPAVFDHFIASHGGYELSGPPIADTIRYNEENVIRQCYENYCLDYFPQAAGGDKVRLAPLGSRYLGTVDPAVISRSAAPQREVDLILSEAQPQLPPNQTQRIYLFVFEKEGQKGIAGVEATLVLHIGGTPVTYTTPPTDESGWANITIPPISGLPNSTIIPYEACLNLASLQPVCKKESYLIWKLP
ncbi:MAG: hypothetical protein IT308_06435 [Anaerolineaceae bacterium]|nr:hypothetical protein [Anaerolineaceae bacterium]